MEEIALVKQIEIVLEEKVRPILLEHDGNVQLISVEDGICRVKLEGKCAGCPSANLTKEEIIGKEIMETIPAIKDVILVQEVSTELLDFAKKILRYKVTQ